MAGVEVWFQRASDCVRKLISGDVDMGIVGYDMVQEYGEVSSCYARSLEAFASNSCARSLRSFPAEAVPWAWNESQAASCFLGMPAACSAPR